MDNNYEIRQQIRKAFYWLDMINLSGDAVEVMAMARKELRTAQAMCRDDAEPMED